MKSMIVFSMVVCVCVAASLQGAPGPDASAQVLRNDNNNIGIGQFDYAVDTTNGIQIQAQGNLNNVGTENEAQEIRGTYEYIGDDGQLYKVEYVANELGFQPKGAHLPSGPQI